MIILIATFLYWNNQSDAQLLYKCTSKTRDTVFYLFGTCHYLPVTSRIDTALLGTLIRGADIVFSELYVDDGDSSYKKSISGLRRLSLYKNQGSLSDSLTRKQYAQVMRFYQERYGVSKKEFQAQTYYIPQIMDNHLRYNSRNYYSIDLVLSNLALASGNRIKNLDNEHLITRAVQQISVDYNIRWLLNMVNKKSDSSDDLIMQSYLQQDTAGILKAFHQDNSNPVSEQVMLENRNRHWINVIEQYKAQTNFLFCGISHILYREYSLLNLFREKGYTVKAVDIKVD